MTQSSERLDDQGKSRGQFSLNQHARASPMQMLYLSLVGGWLGLNGHIPK
jgi:hypothetical protein